MNSGPQQYPKVVRVERSGVVWRFLRQEISQSQWSVLRDIRFFHLFYLFRYGTSSGVQGVLRQDLQGGDDDRRGDDEAHVSSHEVPGAAGVVQVGGRSQGDGVGHDHGQGGAVEVRAGQVGTQMALGMIMANVEPWKYALGR